MTINYKVGDVIEHHPFGVPEAKRQVRVTGRSRNIKNGQAGFDGYTPEGLSVWGYDAEVQRVIEPRKVSQ